MFGSVSRHLMFLAVLAGCFSLIDNVAFEGRFTGAIWHDAKQRGLRFAFSIQERLSRYGLAI